MTAVTFPEVASGPSTASGAGLVAVGLIFNKLNPGEILGFSFDSPAVQASGVKIALYKNGASSIVAQKSGLSLSAGVNYLEFDDPVTIDEDSTYFAFVFQPSLNYHYGATMPEDTVMDDWEVGPYNATGGTPMGAYIEDDDIISAPIVYLSDGRVNYTSNYYGLRLWWDDAEDVPEDTLTVTTNTPQTVVEGSVGTMVATPHDAVGSVSYVWTKVSGPSSPTINNSTSATATITPTVSGTYVYQVTATDDVGEDTATVTFTVESEEEPEEPPPSTTSGDAIWFKHEGEWVGPFGQSTQVDDPWVFRPENYGAVGDGVTDDTAAFNDCVEAAVAAAPDNNYLAVVQLGAKVYALNTPAVPGRHHGNAMISIPFVDALTTKKIHLAFLGPADNSGFIHWAQTSKSHGGATLRSLWNPTTLLNLDENDVSFGVPSVLGVITNFDSVPATAYQTVSNMHVSVDGVQIMVPQNSRLGGFDFGGVAHATVNSACVLTDDYYDGSPDIRQQPTHDQSFGLRLPRSGSNARNSVGDFIAEGLSVGLITGEHFSAQYLGMVYCRVGLQLASNGNTYYWDAADEDDEGWPHTFRPASHGAYIGRLLTEGCVICIENLGFNAQINISSFDGEGVGSFVKHIDDPNNMMVGEIHFNDVWRYVPVVNGASRVRIVADGVERGAKTAPSLPATTVPLLNPFWRDADVYISGGTVTGIAVDGLTLGVTSGHVRVPTGKTITLVYSSAPTWTWVLP